MLNPTSVVCLGVVVLSLAGCGKKQPAAAADGGGAASAAEPVPATAAGEPAATPATTDQAQSPQAKPAPSADNADANEAVAGTVDEFMTGQLRVFIEEKGRLPVDFAEFAAARMDSIPRTP
ncbi:MAG TPA: hypothetical protein VH598_14505, partial [Verrucomicrobiae bacterium]|nr:hypothetical protein [Verrucomicrobiae bacterium]